MDRDIIASGGPEDDALSSAVLAGEADITVSQDAVHVDDDEEGSE